MRTREAFGNTYAATGPESQAIRTLPEVLREYETVAQEATRQHEASCHAIAANHQLAFSAEAKRPGSQNIEEALRYTNADLDETATRTRHRITDLTLAATRAITPMLTRGDENILEAVKYDIAYGSDSRPVQRTADIAARLSAAKEPHAIRAALDSEILSKLQAILQGGSFGSRQDEQEIDWLLNQASSPRIRRAMQASLDGQFFDRLRATVGHSGFSPYKNRGRSLDALLGQFSSPTVRAAMRCLLDGNILDRVRAQKQAGLHGASSRRNIEDYLSYTSSKKVRHVFETMELKQEAGGANKKSVSLGSFMRDVIGGWRNARHSQRRQRRAEPSRGERVPPKDSFDYAAFMRDAYAREARFRHRGEGAQRPGHQEQSQQESDEQQARAQRQREKAERQRQEEQQRLAEERRLREEAERREGEEQQLVLQVMGDAAVLPGRGWMLGANPLDVRRVIANIRELRRRNTGITDREIYLRFYRAADAGQQDGVSTANPRLRASFSILDAMMDGPNGRIPSLTLREHDS